jgi:Papain-like cysteine protease AvrRpt2
MSRNRLLSLQEDMKTRRLPSVGLKPILRGVAKAKPAPTPTPAPAPKVQAQALSRYRPGFATMLARSFSYKVPGTVYPIAQDKTNACWATVASMMLSWRDNWKYSMSIDDSIALFGAKWQKIYRDNTGLTAADKPLFLASAGLHSEPPASYTIELWESFLRNYGPLWVTTNEGAGTAFFSPHARIITGITSDGSPENTSVDVVDPNGGRCYVEKFVDFVRKYEDDVTHLSTPRVQIVHWGADARKTGP